MLIGFLCLLSFVLAAMVCGYTAAFASYDWMWMLPLCVVGFFVALAALFFLFVCLTAAVVRRDKPQEKDNRFYRWLIYLLADTIPQILRARVHTTGLEQTPTDGRFLLVCNHINDLDPVVLLSCFKKSQLAFISKRENTDMFIVGKMMHKIQCQLVNRENDREAMKTILNCVRIIKEDKASIAVFPEGYTSMDGLLRPFRSGVFKIAQRAQVPIVVCTLRNTNQALKNFLHGKSTDIYMNLLTVLPPESLKGKTAVQIGTEVYEMMAADLGEDLVYHENS